LSNVGSHRELINADLYAEIAEIASLARSKRVRILVLKETYGADDARSMQQAAKLSRSLHERQNRLYLQVWIE